MAISLIDIRRIHSNHLAVNGKTYYGADGYSYLGQPNGRLLRKDLAENITFEPTEEIRSKNVSGAIDDTSKLTQATQTAVNFDQDETVYVTIPDLLVTSESSITCSMSTGSDRDMDELELVDFTYSICNIIERASYDVIINDTSYQAEGDYILNTIRR